MQLPSQCGNVGNDVLRGRGGGAELLGDVAVTNVVGVLPPPPVSPAIDPAEPHERIGNIEENDGTVWVGGGVVGEQAIAVDGDVVVVLDWWEGDGLSGERVPQPGVGGLSEDEHPSLRRAEAEVISIHHDLRLRPRPAVRRVDDAPLGKAIYEHLFCGCGSSGSRVWMINNRSRLQLLICGITSILVFVDEQGQGCKDLSRWLLDAAASPTRTLVHRQQHAHDGRFCTCCHT